MHQHPPKLERVLNKVASPLQMREDILRRGVPSADHQMAALFDGGRAADLIPFVYD